MAYASKGEQRVAGATNYKGSASTLTSSGVKGVFSVDHGPKKLWGNLGGRSGNALGDLYGKGESAKMTSGVAGKMSGDGFPNGPKWKRAMEPGELKPGKPSQAHNTTRMMPGKGDKTTVMKVTSTMPKKLRGGGSGPR